MASSWLLLFTHNWLLTTVQKDKNYIWLEDVDLWPGAVYIWSLYLSRESKCSSSFSDPGFHISHRFHRSHSPGTLPLFQLVGHWELRESWIRDWYAFLCSWMYWSSLTWSNPSILLAGHFFYVPIHIYRQHNLVACLVEVDSILVLAAVVVGCSVRHNIHNNDEQERRE